jgi:hypothetical protein
MPRKRRTQRQRRDEYHEGHRLQLEIGHDYGLYGGPAFGNGEDLDRDAALAAWEIFRGEILAEHIGKHPCTRPWAWWHLEPRELRRRVDGGIHPCENPARTCPEYCDDGSGRIPPWYGLPRVVNHVDDFDALYESVPAYLLRLNLLTRTEREYLDENPELLEPAYADGGRGW